MTEPRWLTPEMVRALHDQAVALFGGSTGLRDPGLLESALDRPRNLFAYGNDPSLFDLAATCAAIVRNHPFVDGNKRAAAMAALVFLHVNGAPRLPEPDELEHATLAIAAGQMSKEDAVRWMRTRVGEDATSNAD